MLTTCTCTDLHAHGQCAMITARAILRRLADPGAQSPALLSLLAGSFLANWKHGPCPGLEALSLTMYSRRPGISNTSLVLNK